MGCRAPRELRFPYLPAGEADDTNVLGTIETPCLAVEIAPDSDIDDCLLLTPDGPRVVAVGAPAVGPFTDRMVVRANTRQIPWSPGGGGTNWLGQNIRGSDKTRPALRLRVHTDVPPCGWMRKRAPTRYRNVQFATDANQPTYILEVPVGGRKKASIWIRNHGADIETDWRILGCIYEPASAGSETGGEGSDLGILGNGTESVLVPLALDSAGATSVTLTTSQQTKVYDFYDAAYDSLVIEVTDDGSSRTPSAWARVEDE